jgi:hypothetical protein
MKLSEKLIPVLSFAAAVAVLCFATGANAQAKTTCTFDPPAAAISRSSVASEAVFSRVIYDFFGSTVDGSLSAPLKVGVTFRELAVAPSINNKVVVDPATGAHRLDDGAPVNATLYPVKAIYVYCRAFRNSIEREVVQQNFVCFKDKFGDWTCPTDSFRKVLESSSTPIGK